MKKTYEEIVAENIFLVQQVESKDIALTSKDTEIANKNIEIADKDAKITALEVTLENKELELNTLRRFLFGSKRESTPNNEDIVDGVQCSFLGDPVDEEVKQEMEKQDEEIIVHRKKNSKKAKAGIKKSALKDIEIETVEVVIDDEKLECPECGGNLIEIGKEFVRDEIKHSVILLLS